ncbi:hypothetical protein N9M66_02045 [Litoreibacter sp.]|nr:hypothetical protein [Litoreibacter sp.]
MDFAAAGDTEIAEWIKAECRFPATMLDRITPATTKADVAKFEAQAGYFGAAPVFRSALINALEGLLENGARHCVDAFSTNS